MRSQILLIITNSYARRRLAAPQMLRYLHRVSIRGAILLASWEIAQGESWLSSWVYAQSEAWLA